MAITLDGTTGITTPEITSAGGTLTGNLNFGDGDSAFFGDSNDLQIVHNGSHSYIADSGTGNLYIQTTAGLIVQNSSGTETMATFTENGAVDLYYDNALKLATTATGIDVTGTIALPSASFVVGGGTTPSVYRTGADGSGIHFSTNSSLPTNELGIVSDNTEQWGSGSYRWSVIYAATGAINTSDCEEKQDIQDLSAAELLVAQEIKSLFKTFRWKGAVAEKGDNARIHVGVIAQDVQDAFANHGLDASRYALWCSDTWYEVDGQGISNDGVPYTSQSAGAVEKTRLGIRYDQLLAFVVAAL